MGKGSAVGVVAVVAWVVACAGYPDDPPTPTTNVPIPGETGGPDASTPPPPGCSATTPCPPPPPPDAGTPTDPPPPAFTLPGNGPVITGDKTGWSSVQAAPRAFGAAVDQGGNLFVVAGREGLYVRRAGRTSFDHHALPQPAMSVAAGKAGVAYVGYAGEEGCDMVFFYTPRGPASVYKSGDADRIVLSGEGINRYHYDISSPAGVSSDYPDGREKLCDVHRVLFDPVSNSVWFGANHGVAWGDPDSTRTIEHTHPAINCYSKEYAEDPNSDLTMCSGSYWALAADSKGDLWLGGTERSAHFPFMTLGKNFDAADRWINAKDANRRDFRKIDWWADKFPTDARPSQRVDDRPMGFAPTAHGTWVGSLLHGAAFRDNSGKITHFTEPLLSKEISAVRLDPKDGSVWFGHTNGGITRLKDNTWVHYKQFMGKGRIWDIQIDTSSSERKVVVALQSGTVAIYSGE